MKLTDKIAAHLSYPLRTIMKAGAVMVRAGSAGVLIDNSALFQWIGGTSCGPLPLGAYRDRSAVIGSTRDARHAGAAPANSAVTTSTPTAAANVAGSRDSTP